MYLRVSSWAGGHGHRRYPMAVSFLALGKAKHREKPYKLGDRHGFYLLIALKGRAIGACVAVGSNPVASSDLASNPYSNLKSIAV
jgi:hypothetical protein